MSSQEQPTPEELRQQVEATREELGRTVEALAARTDVKTRARHKAAAMREQLGAKGAHTRALGAQAKAQVAETVPRALRTARTRIPEPVREKTGRAAAKAGGTATQVLERAPEPVREKARAAGERPALLLGAAGGGIVLWLAMRRRG
jgi:hypothetical protein